MCAAKSCPSYIYCRCFAVVVCRFTCPICDKAFARLDQLKLVHMRQHDSTPEPCPFTCITCHKRFKVRGKLEQHQILHTGITILAPLHYVSPNTNVWTHIFLCILLSLATTVLSPCWTGCLFSVTYPLLLLQQTPTSLLEQNVDAGDCWIMKTSNPKTGF